MNFEDSDRVMKYNTQHSYIELATADDIVEAYNASEKAEREKISLLSFPEPPHSNSITNGTNAIKLVQIMPL